MERALCAASVADEHNERNGEARVVAPKQPNHDESDEKMCNQAQDEWSSSRRPLAHASAHVTTAPPTFPPVLLAYEKQSFMNSIQ